MPTGTWITNIDMTVSDAGQRCINHKVSSHGGGNLPLPMCTQLNYCR